MTAALRRGQRAGLSLAALPEFLIPSKYLPNLRQGGPGLPGRELPLVSFLRLLAIIRYNVVEPLQWFQCHELRCCFFIPNIRLHMFRLHATRFHSSEWWYFLFCATGHVAGTCSSLVVRKSKHPSQVNLSRRAVHEQLALPDTDFKPPQK